MKLLRILTFVGVALSSLVLQASPDDWEKDWDKRLDLARRFIKVITPPERTSSDVCYHGRKMRERIETVHSYWFLPGSISELAGLAPHKEYCSREISAGEISRWNYARMWKHADTVSAVKKEYKELQALARLAVTRENKSEEYLTRLDEFERTLSWPGCQGTSDAIFFGSGPHERCSGGQGSRAQLPFAEASDEGIPTHRDTNTSAPSQRDVLLRLLESDSPQPLTDEQAIIRNSWLDEIGALEDGISFTPGQFSFVSAVCSNLNREVRDSNIQEFSRNTDPLVLILGATGAGKSTLVDLLTNKRLEARRSSENPRRIKIIGPSTGTGDLSKTSWPELHRDLENNLSYADNPGSNDNRGKLQQIRNSISIRELFKNPESVKFMVVDTAASIEDVAHGGHFIEMLRGLKRMVRTAPLSNHISLVVTQHSEDHMDVEHLRSYMDRLSHNPAHYDIVDLLTYFSMPDSRIAFFVRPPASTPEGDYSNGLVREEVLNVIRRTDPFLLNADTKREIHSSFSDFSAPLVSRMNAGIVGLTRTILEHGVVTPIEIYIKEKVRSTRDIINRHIDTGIDARLVLKSYFKNLLIEMKKLRSGISSDGELLSDSGLLKIIRQRIKPDAATFLETDMATSSDLSAIRKSFSSLGFMHFIRGTHADSFLQDIWDPVFSESEQTLEKLTQGSGADDEKH